MNLGERRVSQRLEELLTSFPPGTDPTMVAIVLIREGLRYFVATRGLEPARHTALAVLEYLRETSPKDGG